MTKSDYYTSEQEQISKIAKAIGNPTRVAILQLLSSQSCCYHGDMAEELPIAKYTLSQKKKKMKEEGLIQDEINPPTVKYCFN